MPDIETKATLDAIHRFNEAFNRHDVDGVMAMMTADCVFENTQPSPDGERFVGAAAVRTFWTRFFESTPGALHAHVQKARALATGAHCDVITAQSEADVWRNHLREPWASKGMIVKFAWMPA